MIRYDLPTLTAALALAVLGAVTALALLRRGRDRQVDHRKAWLIGGGVMLGLAGWSMHALAMLAMRPTAGIGFAAGPMLVAVAVGVPFIGLSFAPLAVERPGARRLIASGAALGLGICAIHYAGMTSVRGGSLQIYDPLRVAASAFLAAIGSTIALWIAVRRDGVAGQAVAALGLAGAVAGTHVLGMSAVTFALCDAAGTAGGGPAAASVARAVHLPFGAAAHLPVGAIAAGLGVATVLLFTVALLLSLFDRRLAELAQREVAIVRASEQRLRAILDQLPLGIGIAEAERGPLVIANRQAHVLLGRTPAFDRLLPFAPDPAAEGTSGEPPRSPIERAQAGERVEGELFLRARPDGSTATLEIGAAPILDGAGRQVLTVATVKDVTARVEAEAAQLRAQKMEALGQLTGGVAHDFNNLLTAVLNNLDLLETELHDPEAKHRLRLAVEAAERGARLTAQLLGFSRRQALQPATVDVAAAIGGMADLLASTLGRTAVVRTEFADDLWSALADPTQLELVLLNLAINARDAMPLGGTILIRAANARSGPPASPNDPPAGDHVVLSVSDTGTGMSAVTAARAFEPFFTTKPAGKGSGLGLAQVLGIVQGLGGGVQIQSREGVGTTVSLFIPRGEAVVRPAARPPADAVDTGALRGRTVLLVDDDNDVRIAAQALLGSFGCRVIEAASGRAGLDALAAVDGRVDIALLDHAMPGLTGIETIGLIRASWPALPVMLMTGYAEPEVLAVLGEGADRVPILLKPFRGATLLARLEAMFAAETGGSRDPAAGRAGRGDNVVSFAA